MASMPLESGECSAHPPMGKGCVSAVAAGPAESLRRPVRVDDRGRGTAAVQSGSVPSSVRRSVGVFDHKQPNFADRHIGPDADDVATMLKTIGVGSLDELADKALPGRHSRRVVR